MAIYIIGQKTKYKKMAIYIIGQKTKYKNISFHQFPKSQILESGTACRDGIETSLKKCFLTTFYKNF